MRTVRRATLALIVGLTATVALAMQAGPAAASGGGGCGRPITDRVGKIVRIKNSCFLPTVIHSRVGDTVVWVNRDPWEHNVLGANGAWGGYEPLELDDVLAFRFQAPGVYAYSCTLHPGMVGSVAVGETVPSGPARIDGNPVVPVSMRRAEVAPSVTMVAYTRAGGQPQPPPKFPGWQVATLLLALLLMAALTALTRTWWRTRRQGDPEESPTPAG